MNICKGYCHKTGKILQNIHIFAPKAFEIALFVKVYFYEKESLFDIK
jgi:hypothetical protein